MLKHFILLLRENAGMVLLLLNFTLIPYTIFNATGSPAASVIGLILGFFVLLCTIYYVIKMTLNKPKILKMFGLSAVEPGPILLKKEEAVVINDRYEAEIETAKSFVFPRSPSTEELVDIVDVIAGVKFQSNIYTSVDSDIQKIVRISPNRIAVYWKPKTTILPFVPYVHSTRIKIPSLYGDDAFYQINYVDLNTGLIEWNFDAAHPIAEAYARVLPKVKDIDPALLNDLFIRSQVLDCNQPIIGSDGLSMKWKLTNPTRWKTYILMAFYQNGRSKFVASLKDQPRRRRFRDLANLNSNSVTPLAPE